MNWSGKTPEARERLMILVLVGRRAEGIRSEVTIVKNHEIHYQVHRFQSRIDDEKHLSEKERVGNVRNAMY